MSDKYLEIQKKIRDCSDRNNGIKQKSQKGDFRFILSYAVDFFSCVAAGTVIGYVLDSALGTGCIFIISLFLCGVVAGIYNVLKKYKHL